MARNKSKKMVRPRDPTCGRVSFKTGKQKTRKDRERNRSDKYARRLKEKQLREEE